MRAAAPPPPLRETMRLDKWLVQARFFRTRSLACETVEAGRIRVNGARTSKPAFAVGAGDTLTFALAGRIRLVRILGLSPRRGPAAEAQQLYYDLDGPAPPGDAF